MSLSDAEKAQILLEGVIMVTAGSGELPHAEALACELGVDLIVWRPGSVRWTRYRWGSVTGARQWVEIARGTRRLHFAAG